LGRAGGNVAGLTVAANSVVGRAAGDITAIAVGEAELLGRSTGGALASLAKAAVKTILGFIENLVEDTTPQLGGDLDCNGKKITSASNGDIVLDPDGTGKVSVSKMEMADQAFFDAEVDATSTTFDLTLGNNQKKTMAANVTMSVTVPGGIAAGHLRLTGHATNTYTIAWPSSSPKTQWLGTAITSITAGKTALISWFYDGATLWLSCPELVTTP
jgi:hypothetical protein